MPAIIQEVSSFLHYLKENEAVDYAHCDDNAAPDTLIGNSHSGPILSAAHQATHPMRGIWITQTGPQPTHTEDLKNFHPLIVQWLQIGRVFSAISRSTHDVLSLLKHPQPFDVVIPNHLNLPLEQTAEILPYRAVVSAMKTHMDYEFALLNLLQSICGARLTHIVSQPPLKDNELVAISSPWAVSGAQDISPSYVRLKMYLIYRDIMVEWCRSAGAAYIFPPPSAITAEGFLDPRYCSNATHGNVAYGHLVVDQIRGHR